MTEVKIYKLESEQQEIHMVGSYVGVCWTLMERKREITQDGVTYKASVYERQGDPYVVFATIRQERNGEFYRCEDSSVAGGIGPLIALQVAEELKRAAEYIEGLK